MANITTVSTVKKISIVAFILFLVLPITELAVIFAVSDRIGFGITLALLIGESLFGAWIVSREGGRAWRALKDALTSGNMPSGELADGALVLVGGALLLTPGFITDFLGFFFVIPFTRPIARRALQRLIKSQLLGATRISTYDAYDGNITYGSNDSYRGNVVQGEIIDPASPNEQHPER